MKKSKIEREFVNPFTDTFLPTWQLWKDYKEAEFKFKYKSVLSEQAAINLLVRLSEGDETMAAAIIRQSMENGWQGLFPYKDKTLVINGKQGQSASNPGKTTRESVNNAYSKRFGNGG